MSAAGPLLRLDETSALALCQAAATLAEVEAALAARGLWLGSYPVESRARTVAEALGSPRPSEAGPGGRFTDRCAALHAVLPDGTAIETRLAPRRATGPDYAAALLGAGGGTGRITAAWLRARRRPPMTSFCGFVLGEGVAALEGAYQLLATGALPTDAALLDRDLAQEAVVDAGAGVAAALPAAGTLLLLRFDGARQVVLAEERRAAELVGGLGGPAATPLAPRLVEELLCRRAPLRLVERFVPVEQLRGAFGARGAPTALLGIRHAGAAFCVGSAASLPAAVPPSPLLDTLHAALQQALRPFTPPSPPPPTSPSPHGD